MPTAYYVCPRCRQPFRTRYQTDTAPEVRCSGRGDRPHAPMLMQYRGDGWSGRRPRTPRPRGQTRA